MPPLPPAKDSTIFGGAIRKIDPVRDQFMLDIYGQHPMKVLFDERTQVYRDGVKIPLHDLGPADHASVQTALDGTRIFAISVHILSTIPQGQYRGRVLRFDESTGELRLDASPSPQPFHRVRSRQRDIVRKGQPAFTQEGAGRWRSAPRRSRRCHIRLRRRRARRRQSDRGPGSSRRLLHLQRRYYRAECGFRLSLTLVDPRDQKSYQISFIPSAFPLARTLHIGQRVRITASFDGSSYLASDITAY